MLSTCTVENLVIPTQRAQEASRRIGTQGATFVDLAAQPHKLAATDGTSGGGGVGGGGGPKWSVGELEYEAMMRHLDAAGYRTGYTYKQPFIARPSASRAKSVDVEIPPAATSLSRDLVDFELGPAPTYAHLFPQLIFIPILHI